MALTRFLPTPSDRMGILWSLLQIKDAVILEYSTEGTTAYAMKTFMMMGMDVENKLFATGLDENSVVMGDMTSLEKKIVELDKKYSPKAIFVMASSVSSVTGSDVKGVCRYMQSEVDATLIVFTQGGFNGDYSSGIQSCYTDLVQNFATDEYDKENSYNILGIDAMQKSCRADVLAIQNLMKTNLRLDKHAVLSYETSLDNIKTMSKAKVNIVLSYEGLKAAKILQDRFKTPYVYTLPIGSSATNNLVLEVSKVLDTDVEILNPKEEVKINRDVIIYASYDKALGIKKYVEELGCNVLDVICTHKIKNKEDIRYIKNEKEKIDLFKSAKDSIVFADSTFLRFVDESNVKIDLSQLKSIFGDIDIFKLTSR